MTTSEVFQPHGNELLYAVSHDLASPLRTAGGFARLLQRRGTLDATSTELVGHIVSATVRMQSMLDDLLLLSRTQSRPLDVEPVDMAALVAAAANRARVAGGVLDVSQPTPLDPVAADPALLGLAVEHLLGNAVLHGQAAGMGLEVRTHPSAIGWTLHVRDFGPGLDRSVHDRAMRIFGQVGPPPTGAGNGIGLPLCAVVAERHGGHLELDAAPGGGLEVRLTLPGSRPSNPAG